MRLPLEYVLEHDTSHETQQITEDRKLIQDCFQMSQKKKDYLILISGAGTVVNNLEKHRLISCHIRRQVTD